MRRSAPAEGSLIEIPTLDSSGMPSQNEDPYTSSSPDPESLDRQLIPAIPESHRALISLFLLLSWDYFRTERPSNSATRERHVTCRRMGLKGHRRRGIDIGNRMSNMRNMGTGRRISFCVGGMGGRLCGHADVFAVVADQRQKLILTLWMRDGESDGNNTTTREVRLGIQGVAMGYMPYMRGFKRAVESRQRKVWPAR
jgi:hypothetical protein